MSTVTGVSNKWIEESPVHLCVSGYVEVGGDAFNMKGCGRSRNLSTFVPRRKGGSRTTIAPTIAAEMDTKAFRAYERRQTTTFSDVIMVTSGVDLQ